MAKGKDADTKRQRGRYWTRKEPLRGALLQANLQIIAWNALMTARVSISGATPPSIAAMVTVSDFVRLSRPVVMSRAMVRADGTRRKLSASAFSARRRRAVHSETTRRHPRKPWRFKRRQSSQPFRAPACHWPSSHSRQGSKELSRDRKTSERWPLSTRRTRPRLWPVSRTISLIDAPPLARARIAALASRVSGNPHIGAVRRQSAIRD